MKLINNHQSDNKPYPSSVITLLNGHKLTLDQTVLDAVRQNAFVFLNKAIVELCSHNDAGDAPLEMDNATISVSLIQIAFDLALNAYAIKNNGVRSILNAKTANLSNREIKALFESNELPTKRFEDLKNDMQAEHSLFTEDNLDIIASFQKTRNKLVHLHYHLAEGDRYDLKSEIIYYIVHVMIPLLQQGSDYDTASQMIESCLDEKIFKKLISFPPYVYEMEKLASRDSFEVWRCIGCSNRTYAAEMEVCYVCNRDYDDQEFAHCNRCNTRNSIIFDHLNIESNDNEMRGLCLNCDEDDIIFKCPKCEMTYGIETCDERCDNKHCINR